MNNEPNQNDLNMNQNLQNSTPIDNGVDNSIFQNNGEQLINPTPQVNPVNDVNMDINNGMSIQSDPLTSVLNNENMEQPINPAPQVNPVNDVNMDMNSGMSIQPDPLANALNNENLEQPINPAPQVNPVNDISMDMNSGINMPTDSMGINMDSNVYENNIGESTSIPVMETIPDNNIVEEVSNISDGMNNQTIDSIQPVDNMVSQPNQDNFNEVPVPPVLDDEKPEKKKGSKKLLLAILFILLIISVGFGIYYFLVLGKSNSPLSGINAKELKIELGSELSNNVEDYATIKGYNKKTCSVETKNVDSSKVGAYKYYVICGDKKVEGSVIIDDTKAPEVVTNEVVVLTNSKVKVDDFIDNCLDASSCTYEFEDEQEVLEALKNVGEYEIKINISDEYNNESKVKGKLIVSNNAPVKYVTCTSKEIDVDDIYATLINSYKIGVDSSNAFYNSVKTSEFIFSDKKDYKSIKKEYKEEEGINGIVGKVTFNENNNTILIKGNKTLEEINKDLNINLPKDVSTIQMFLAMNGFTCK